MQGLRDVVLCTVCLALGSYVTFGITLAVGRRCFGPARDQVEGESILADHDPGSVENRLKALTMARPGEIILISSCGVHDDISNVGDL